MTKDQRGKVIETFGWAIDIVSKHFSRGLELWFDPERMRRQVDEFIVDGDPVYSRLLRSSGRDLYETFIGYWKLGQTIASQSRFWLEAAICDIVRKQRSRFGTQVYALHDLPDRPWTDPARAIAFMGDNKREWDYSTRAFRVELSRGLLEEVDQIVGRQERRPSLPRHASRDDERQEAVRLKEVDREALNRILRHVADGQPEKMPIQCNLLVIEPDPGHVWALRYVNEKALGRPELRQERANILRVFGWLCQEKILRRPDHMTAAVTEILPRFNTFPAQRGATMFSNETWWSHDDFWDFVGVPYEVVELGVDRVGKELRAHLIKSLKTIVPST